MTRRILALSGEALYSKHGGEENAILLKILCAPVVAVLAVAGWFFTFLLSVSAAVLGIAAAVLGLLGLFILILDSAVNGVIVLGVALPLRAADARCMAHSSAARTEVRHPGRRV